MEISADIYQGGRVTIPAPIRKALDIHAGEEVTFRYKNDELVLLTQKQLLAEARAALKGHIPDGISLVDELFSMRQEEVAKEDAEQQKQYLK